MGSEFWTWSFCCLVVGRERVLQDLRARGGYLLSQQPPPVVPSPQTPQPMSCGRRACLSQCLVGAAPARACVYSVRVLAACFCARMAVTM